MTAQRYLEELKSLQIDSLVLGCTHYPLLKDTINSVVEGKIKLVNPARETARDLKDSLTKNNLLNDGSSKQPYYKYYVSDIPERFATIGKEFLNREIEDINQIEIQKY